MNFTCKLLAQLARSLFFIILEYDSRFFFSIWAELSLAISSLGLSFGNGGLVVVLQEDATPCTIDACSKQRIQHTVQVQQACSKHAVFTAQRFVCSARMDELPANALD